MASRYGWPVALSLVAFATVSTPAVPDAARRPPGVVAARPISTFATRSPPRAAADAARIVSRRRSQRERLNRDSGSLRVLEQPGLDGRRPQPVVRDRPMARVGSRTPGADSRPTSARSSSSRDYTTRATGVRHLLFRQVLDGHPVFDSAVAHPRCRERPRPAHHVECRSG